jgi:3-oxoacyl-[acyl-carrier-protein] synthase-1
MIVIAGGEILCAPGDLENSVQALRTGRCRCDSIRMTALAGCPSYPYYLLDEQPRRVCADDVEQYLLRVANPLLARVFAGQKPPPATGVFLGSSTIDYSIAEPIEQNAAGRDPAQITCKRVGGGLYVDRIMNRLGLSGPAITVNTACTSSINALMEAAAMLECGLIDYALVLGLELMLPIVAEGFAQMQLLSPDLLRPFSQNRNGMILGEAVSAVLLGREDTLPSSTWHYLGGQSMCETHSVTGVDPSGAGIAALIQQVLASTETNPHPACQDNKGDESRVYQAGTAPGFHIKPEQLTAIKAHGTGGAMMDRAEMSAMETVFADSMPPYFSLKPFIGHTLGGCGLAELILVMASVDRGFIPATPNATPLDEQFRIPPTSTIIPVEGGRFMLNYFGFGGNSASCIIEKAP